MRILPDSTRIRSVLAITAFTINSVYAAPPDAQTLVKRADEFRQLYSAAIMDVRLVQFHGEKSERESHLKVAVQGSDKSLIRVIEGADAGQHMLMTNEGLWIKLPRSTRTVRITPMQRLLGEASVGDIGRMRWQDDYTAEYGTNAEIELAGEAAWLLELTAKSDMAVYPHIQLAVSRANARPIEATFFLKSGKSFKSVTFDKPVTINDRLGVKRMVFKDLIRPENRTEMVMEQTLPKALSKQMYALESLGEWR
ncbi:MAG: outer membrane lipoprotein-sorting protein [Gammaproteobacteria bacterium]|nr:outer membrane lipoprotein-sorting protein [Gammaproteobacteria bacterium]